MDTCNNAGCLPAEPKEKAFIPSFHDRLEKITYEIGYNASRLLNKTTEMMGSEPTCDPPPPLTDAKCAQDALENRIAVLGHISIMLEQAVNRVCKFV